MDANPDIWIWLYAPLFLIGLCLSLIYGCFTWKNMAAWVITLFIGQILINLFLEPVRELIYALAFALVSFCMMGVNFYGVQKRTPIKQFLSFTLFTATSYPVANMFFAVFLFSFGLFPG